jgi:hypothetical protein
MQRYSYVLHITSFKPTKGTGNRGGKLKWRFHREVMGKMLRIILLRECGTSPLCLPPPVSQSPLPLFLPPSLFKLVYHVPVDGYHAYRFVLSGSTQVSHSPLACTITPPSTSPSRTYSSLPLLMGIPTPISILPLKGISRPFGHNGPWQCERRCCSTRQEEPRLFQETLLLR